MDGIPLVVTFDDSVWGDFLFFGQLCMVFKKFTFVNNGKSYVRVTYVLLLRIFISFVSLYFELAGVCHLVYGVKDLDRDRDMSVFR